MLNAIKNVGLKLGIVLGLSIAVGANLNLAHSEKLPLEGKTLNVAFAIVPPFVSVEPGSFDTLTGIDVDMVLELQRRTGFKLKDNRFELMNFGDMLAQTEKGNVDMCAGGIYLNESRAKRYHFGAAYYKTSMGVMASKNSGINSFEDLDNKTLSALQGSTATEAIPKNLNIRVKEAYSPTTFMALYSVAVGDSEVAIGDVPVINDFIDNLLGSNMSLRFIVPNSEAEMGLVINRNYPYAKELQKAMNDMIVDGTAGRIVAKYTSDREANIALTTYERLQKSGNRGFEQKKETQITSTY